jgi:hypothetical protein
MTSGEINDDQLEQRMMEEQRQKIQEHMQVQSSEGEFLGRVDAVEGDRIKLTKNDAPDGQHHYVPLDRVRSVDDVAVYTDMTHDEVRQS